jgi:hypothetical protein
MRSALEGRYFHSFGTTIGTPPRSYVKWQWIIVAKIEPDGYLVELWSWIDGEPTHEQLVAVGEMVNWRFYASAEAMREAYRRFTGKYDGAHMGSPPEPRSK